ncbi:MAG: hypothetical protein DRN12_01245 [Thermoplasmata archaeon]|nr:MAG: hypothetical protein DRN12_01245 [Thermoplasmata archaeon]HEC89913.1 hypothetical protein [Thermoplasmatales archaeon]
MKGRTKCPRCATEFIVEAEEGRDSIETICPKCGHKFTIKIPDEDFTWEEHGEPRKTILPSTRPMTDRPIIVSFILIIVTIICLIGAVLPAFFIETPIAPLSAAGVKGSILIYVVDESGIPQSNITVSISNYINKTNGKGESIIRDVPLGLQTVEVEGYNKTIRRELFIPPFIQTSCNISLSDPTYTSENLVWCQTILIILGVIPLFGAYAAMKRRYLDLVIFSGIIAILSIGFFMINIALGIIAIIILLLSKEEFEDGKKGKRF